MRSITEVKNESIEKRADSLRLSYVTEMFGVQKKPSLVNICISYRRSGIAYMVFAPRGAEAIAGNVSLSADGFSTGLGLCGMAFRHSRFGSSF